MISSDNLVDKEDENTREPAEQAKIEGRPYNLSYVINLTLMTAIGGLLFG